MTSINALKLDHHSGLLICDEVRYWNPEWMIFMTAEKIRRVITPEIQAETGLVLFMGQTGASSIGDEFTELVQKEITQQYLTAQKRSGNPPQIFQSMQALAQMAFEIGIQVKQRHLDDFLVGKFGFSLDELISGASVHQGEKLPITDEDLIKKACEYLTFEGGQEAVRGMLGNSQVLAGYVPDDGFRIYYLSQRNAICEEVPEIFLSQGSGRDTCDLVFTDFANHCSIPQRRGRIDRVAGLAALLKGLNLAFRLTCGVEGYPKIIYVDGRQPPEKRVKEIFDRRSKLASEIVRAEEQRLIDTDDMQRLLADLIFADRSFAAVNTEFFSVSRDPRALLRFLRGYHQEQVPGGLETTDGVGDKALS